MIAHATLCIVVAFEVTSPGVFLSYRRADTGPYARLLQLLFRDRLPDVPIFLDLDSIEAGTDFEDVIRTEVASCAVQVVLIGRRWAIKEEPDYVRMEVQAALDAGLRVIPVLVDGAEPVRPEQLPPELRRLTRLNALPLGWDRYDHDADRIVAAVQSALDVAEPVPPDRMFAVRALAAAEEIANAIAPVDIRGRALAQIAVSLAEADPDRAERLARSMSADGLTEEQGERMLGHRAEALTGVARALVATDPGRAERIVRSLDGRRRDNAVADVGTAIAATDPDRAERIAHSLDERARETVLIAVAAGRAGTDPDHAERVARSIGDPADRAKALVRVASAVAAGDASRAARLVDLAERALWSIPTGPEGLRAVIDAAKLLTTELPSAAVRLLGNAGQVVKQMPRFERRDMKPTLSSGYVDVVSMLAPADPDLAERMAGSLTEQMDRGWALRSVARALAVTDPDRAEQLARSIPVAAYLGLALTAVAEGIAAADPARAERLGRSISDDHDRAAALARVAKVLGGSHPELAVRLAGEAEQGASALDDRTDRDGVLADVAEALAGADPERALRLAQVAIEEPYTRVITLLAIARR